MALEAAASNVMALTYSLCAITWVIHGTEAEGHGPMHFKSPVARADPSDHQRSQSI